MIDYTHVISFALGGTLMWCVLTIVHNKAMNELTSIAKNCLDDVGRHAIVCLKQLSEYIPEDTKK